MINTPEEAAWVEGEIGSLMVLERLLEKEATNILNIKSKMAGRRGSLQIEVEDYLHRLQNPPQTE